MKTIVVLLCVLLFVAVGFSGCVLPAENTLKDGAAGQKQEVESTVSTPPDHGKPQISESETKTSLEGIPNFVATKTVTITNDMSGFGTCFLTLKGVNGQVAVSSWDKSGYSFSVTLKGYGSTPTEAKQNLNDLYVESTDEVSGDALVLKAMGATRSDWNKKSASIAAHVPASPVYWLYAQTSNAQMEIEGIKGSVIECATSNGQISISGVSAEKISAATSNGQISLVDVSAGTASLSTSNGQITFSRFSSETVSAATSNGKISGDIKASFATLRTSNARIDVSVESSGSGRCDLSTSNSDITLKVKNGEDYGYDVSGDTTNGEVTISLSNTEPVGEQSKESKHVRTKNYESKKIRIEADLDTTNGDIEVSEA